MGVACNTPSLALTIILKIDRLTSRLAKLTGFLEIDSKVDRGHPALRVRHAPGDRLRESRAEVLGGGSARTAATAAI